MNGSKNSSQRSFVPTCRTTTCGGVEDKCLIVSLIHKILPPGIVDTFGLNQSLFIICDRLSGDGVSNYLDFKPWQVLQRAGPVMESYKYKDLKIMPTLQKLLKINKASYTKQSCEKKRE